MADRPPMSLEEFKARLPIAEVIGRHVRLSRRGHDLWGCCPFHNEKTASFHVVPDKGFYHCFGCGQHGNAIDFVMAIEGLEFAQAIARLAELTGLPTPLRSEGAPAVDRTLYAANEAAARWYAGRLESRQGAKATEYLAARGLDRATVERFGLGYAPDERTALKGALLAEGYSEAQLLEAGLIAVPESGGPGHDRFRDRVMFPIADSRGRVVGFGGRTLGEARAKYLNTPETSAFHKGELLYGLPLARRAIRERGTVIVVEGYMDVIALAQAGFPHAVAPLGTAISEAQLAQLWQLAEEPIICLDGDAAGLQAGHRLVERALPALAPGKSLRFAILPQGRDPDSVLRARSGTFPRAQALQLMLNEAVPLMDFLWHRETATRSPTVPQHRSALEQRYRALAGGMPQRTLGRLLLGDFFKRLRAASARGAERAPSRGSWPAPALGTSVGPARLASGLAKPEGMAERDLVWPIVAHPQLLDQIEEEFAALELVEAEVAALRDAIVAWYGEHGHLDPSGLRNHLCQIGFASLLGQLAARGSAWRGYGRDPGSELGVWRACVAEWRRRAERREVTLAVEATMAASRDREATERRVAVDRLINPRTGAGARRDDVED